MSQLIGFYLTRLSSTMQPNPSFLHNPPNFWAYVKIVSETIGYSERSSQVLKRYYADDVIRAISKRGFSQEEVIDSFGQFTEFGKSIVEYLNYRSEALTQDVKPNLMDRDTAKLHFEQLRIDLKPQCVLPMNKQKGDKRHYAYLTGIVNMLTEAALGGSYFDANPLGLITITRNNRPIRVLSRRMDGAYPTINNPLAIWEVKEYYGTTTFGSRVADGVYETLLDGLELYYLKEHDKINVLHYLIVDDYFTWWHLGKSYLCRIVDMIHMGIVDEVLFGLEVLERWPIIVKTWR